MMHKSKFPKQVESTKLAFFFSFCKCKSMKLKLSMRNYMNFYEFLKFSLKNNEKKYYMQPNAKYFCLFISNNFENYNENKCKLEQFD